MDHKVEIIQAIKDAPREELEQYTLKLIKEKAETTGDLKNLGSIFIKSMQVIGIMNANLKVKADLSAIIRSGISLFTEAQFRPKSFSKKFEFLASGEYLLEKYKHLFTPENKQ